MAQVTAMTQARVWLQAQALMTLESQKDLKERIWISRRRT